MTHDEAIKYFVYQARSADLPAEDLHNAVKSAIQLGIDDVWYGYPWSFATTGYELTCTTGATSYDLPDNFSGIVGAREKESQMGSRLIFKEKQEFDRIITKTDYFSQDKPYLYTAYYDGATNRHKIAFFPIPVDGTVVYLDIRTKAPTSIDLIPGIAMQAIISAILKYVFPVNSAARDSAARTAYRDFLELQRRDQMNIATPTVMLTADQVKYRVTRPWID